MRILIISSEIPYPPDDSNRAVVYNLLRHFKDRHDITLVAFKTVEPPEAENVVRGLVKKLVLVPHVVKKTMGTRLGSLLSIWPYGVLLYRNREFAAAVQRVLAEEAFDVIIGGNINMAPYTVHLSDIPKIIAPLDAISLYYRRQVSLSGTPASFVYSLIQYWKVRRFESRTYGKYDACVLVAKRDAEVIRELCPGLPIYFAPSGADIPPLRDVVKEPASIAFSGVMDYPPNVDAAVYFAEEIFPYVKAEIPFATFHVVGKNPLPNVKALERLDGVIVTGAVPDVKEYLRKAEVYVCPMRLGAGMKMKIVEALAVALPVVATTRAAEGMDLVAGRDFIVVDEPAAFASAVLRLLRDPKLREEYGTWGRQAVERSYTWDAHARAWDEILTFVAAGRKY